jgi:chromosome segregation ATPase
MVNVTGEVIGSALTPSEAKPVIEGQSKPAEPTVETTDPEQEKFDDKFLKLTRKERQLQQAQQELKAKMAEIEKMKAEYDSFLSRKSKLKENPFDALELLGVTYDDLTQAMLTYDQPVDKLTEIERKLQMLEEREEKAKQSQKLEEEKAIEEQRQKVVETYQSDLAKFIDSSEYELVKANEANETVFEVIQHDYQEQVKAGAQKPVLMEFDEACKRVEEYLESQLDKFLQLNKVKSRFEPKDEPKSSFQQASVTPPKASASMTLTNAMKAATEVTTPQSRRPSEKELFERAASLIKFN